MRQGIALIAILGLASVAGCTHLALQRTTNNQASTLSDLQYKQVLDNLAMFSCNPEAMPWHLKLKDAVVQVSDQGSFGLVGLLGWPFEVIGRSLSPSINGQRGILGQWSGEPTIGSDDLEYLGYAYRKAVNPADDEELDVKIRLAIWKLVRTYDLAPGSDLLMDIIKDSVVKEAKRLEGELNRVRDSNNYSEIDNAISSILIGFKDLQHLVENERLGEYLKDENQLKTEVAMIAASLSPAIMSLDGAEKQTSDAKSKDIILQVRRRISFVVQPETQDLLAESVLRLNPFRESLRVKTHKIQKNVEHSNDRVNFLIIAGNSDYLFSQAAPKQEKRNPGLIDQAEDKLATLKELLNDKHSQCPWFCVGTKKDVPKYACYVGHYSACGHECYVWVTPDQMKELREFTINVLTLAPLSEQDTFSGRGAAFSR